MYTYINKQCIYMYLHIYMYIDHTHTHIYIYIGVNPRYMPITLRNHYDS